MAEVIGDRIAQRMADLGLSQSAVARATGLKQPSIGRLISGQTRRTSHLIELSQALSTTPEYLSGETDDPSPGAATPQLSADDRAILEKFRALSPANRAAVLQMVRAMAGKSTD